MNMERNDFPAGDRTPGSTGDTGVGGGLGNPGTTLGTQGFGGSTAGSTGGTGAAESTGFRERAREVAGTAQEKLADVGSTVRERAGTMKDSLAGALESGADRLRQRVHSSPTTGGGELAAATSVGSITTTDGGKLTVAGERVADGMKATADWIRDADLDNLKQGVERQVKEHPGRTLLIAVGLGYLIGKAFRNR
jgi:hypothetical protein